MSKVDKKKLIKFAKQVNKLKLTEDPISLKGDVEDIQEDFISAIEEIDDDGSIDELDEDTIDFYESLIEEEDDEDEEDDEEDDDDDDEDDEDEEDDEEVKPAKKAKKEKKGKKTKKEKESSVDLPKGLRAGTLPALLYEKVIADGGETTWENLAKLFHKERGKAWGKTWEKCMNPAFRMMSRQVSKTIPVSVKFVEGDEAAAIFSIANDEDDE